MELQHQRRATLAPARSTKWLMETTTTTTPAHPANDNDQTINDKDEKQRRPSLVTESSSTAHPSISSSRNVIHSDTSSSSSQSHQDQDNNNKNSKAKHSSMRRRRSSSKTGTTPPLTLVEIPSSSNSLTNTSNHSSKTSKASNHKKLSKTTQPLAYDPYGRNKKNNNANGNDDDASVSSVSLNSDGDFEEYRQISNYTRRRSRDVPSSSKSKTTSKSSDTSNKTSSLQVDLHSKHNSNNNKTTTTTKMSQFLDWRKTQSEAFVAVTDTSSSSTLGAPSPTSSSFEPPTIAVLPNSNHHNSISSIPKQPHEEIVLGQTLQDQEPTPRRRWSFQDLLSHPSSSSSPKRSPRTKKVQLKPPPPSSSPKSANRHFERRSHATHTSRNVLARIDVSSVVRQAAQRVAQAKEGEEQDKDASVVGNAVVKEHPNDEHVIAHKDEELNPDVHGVNDGKDPQEETVAVVVDNNNNNNFVAQGMRSCPELSHLPEAILEQPEEEQVPPKPQPEVDIDKSATDPTEAARQVPSSSEQSVKYDTSYSNLDVLLSPGQQKRRTLSSFFRFHNRNNDENLDASSTHSKKKKKKLRTKKPEAGILLVGGSDDGDDPTEKSELDRGDSNHVATAAKEEHKTKQRAFLRNLLRNASVRSILMRRRRNKQQGHNMNHHHDDQDDDDDEAIKDELRRASSTRSFERAKVDAATRVLERPYHSSRSLELATTNTTTTSSGKSHSKQQQRHRKHKKHSGSSWNANLYEVSENTVFEAECILSRVSEEPSSLADLSSSRGRRSTTSSLSSLSRRSQKKKNKKSSSSSSTSSHHGRSSTKQGSSSVSSQRSYNSSHNCIGTAAHNYADFARMTGSTAGRDELLQRLASSSSTRNNNPNKSLHRTSSGRIAV